MKTYYQPEITVKFGNDNPDFYSFFVFRSKKLAEKVFPDSKILKYTGDDIENPTFVDYQYYRSAYNVNMKGLEDAFTKQFGFKVKFKTEVVSPMKKPRLQFESQDIISKSGVFAIPLEHAKFSSFHGGVVNDKNRIWFTINLSYRHKHGGTNGLRVAEAWYDFNKKVGERWKVEFIEGEDD